MRTRQQRGAIGLLEWVILRLALRSGRYLHAKNIFIFARWETKKFANRKKERFFSGAGEIGNIADLRLSRRSALSNDRDYKRERYRFDLREREP